MRKRSLYLLCGGRSQRMGVPDKALLQLRGQSLLDLQIERGHVYFQDVVLLCGSNTYNRNITTLPDAIPDAGPLSALLSALEHTVDNSIALAPVDLPQISEDTWRHIATAPLPPDALALIAETEDRLQPLVGVYSVALKEELRLYLSDGGRSVGTFINQIPCSTFSRLEKEFLNINSPDDFKRFKNEAGDRVEEDKFDTGDNQNDCQ